MLDVLTIIKNENICSLLNSIYFEEKKDGCQFNNEYMKQAFELKRRLVVNRKVRASCFVNLDYQQILQDGESSQEIKVFFRGIGTIIFFLKWRVYLNLMKGDGTSNGTCIQIYVYTHGYV